MQAQLLELDLCSLERLDELLVAAYGVERVELLQLCTLVYLIRAIATRAIVVTDPVLPFVPMQIHEIHLFCSHKYAILH